jgi:hypothetical protein
VKKVNYILGGAYKGLLFALYLKNIVGKKITIVTYKNDTIEYCKNEGINFIQFKHIKVNTSSIWKVFSLKKELDKVISKINFKEKDNFFLLGNLKAYDFFYIAKELSYKGNGFFKDTDFENRELPIFRQRWYKPIFFRGSILKYSLKLILGLDLKFYTYNKVPCIGFDENFLKKYSIKKYAEEIPTEKMILAVVKNHNCLNKTYENLIIDDGPFSDIYDFDSVIRLYKYILSLSLTFAFKQRPSTIVDTKKSTRLYYNGFEKCKKIPKHIPAELLCNNIKNNVISIFSTSLITASQFKHLNAISLLNLVDWYNESYKKEYKEYLLKASKNRILFPNSFQELKEILIKS